MCTRIVLLYLLLISSQAVHAEVYKWTDANGKVHYSDKAVGNGEPIRMTKPPPADPEAEIKLQQIRNRLEGSREQQAENAAQEQQLAIERSAQCDKVRKQLKDLEESGQVYHIKDGEHVYLDYKQKDEQMAKSRNFLKQHCD